MHQVIDKLDTMDDMASTAVYRCETWTRIEVCTDGEGDYYLLLPLLPLPLLLATTTDN